MPGLKANSHNKGFFLLELLVALALLLAFSLLLYVPAQRFLHRQYAMQLRLGAQEFAADIRATQQRALYTNATGNRLIIHSDKVGYTLEATQKSKSFAALGCEGVYFYKQAANYISFSSLGAPNGSQGSSYVLKHTQLSDKSITLTLQPSSGRVDINEQ